MKKIGCAIIGSLLLFSGNCFSKENNNIHDSVVLIQYKEAIKKIVGTSWYKEREFKSGWLCGVKLTQNRRGVIYKKGDIKCNTKNGLFIDSVKRAVHMINNFPKARDSFYEEEITLYFYQK